MKAAVTDPALLGAVRPLDLSAYLRAHGWRQESPQDDLELVDWAKDTDHGHVELSVPRHPRWRDYPRRIREVLAELSRDEQRSEALIMQDIARTLRDVVRLRAIVDGRTDGTIPLEDGALLARSARGLMLAAACATHEPRRAYHNRKPPIATEYLHGLSLGQTEVGSFVLTVMSPVPPELASAAIPFEAGGIEPNFNRRVTQTLTTALSAVRSAAETSVAQGDISSFDQAVAKGVSADLCEALALVRDCNTVSHLEVTIGWAPSRPDLLHLPVHHEFAPDTLEVIREAGRALREKSPLEAFELAGIVVSLDRPQVRFAGTAVVLATVDGQARKVRLEVRDEDWKKADEAMNQRLIFRCQGELVREGTLYILRNARDLRVSPVED